MVDRFQIINECLALTSNNLVNVEDDGSDEWTVGSAAYESALRYMLGDHDWKFATEILPLQRIGKSDDDRLTDAFAKPQGSLGLVWVRASTYSMDWKIVGNKVLIGYQGIGVPDITKVTAKVVLAPPDPSAFPPGFNQTLSTFTLSGVYRGLNEDLPAATQAWSAGEGFFSKAKTRSDREQKPRVARRSRILARRRGFIGGIGDR